MTNKIKYKDSFTNLIGDWLISLSKIFMILFIYKSFNCFYRIFKLHKKVFKNDFIIDFNLLVNHIFTILWSIILITGVIWLYFVFTEDCEFPPEEEETKKNERK